LNLIFGLPLARTKSLEPFDSSEATAKRIALNNAPNMAVCQGFVSVAKLQQAWHARQPPLCRDVVIPRMKGA
jgi:hypothetical protein